ncbi:unnamed protein product, partial [Phaeothamnion confervicola]
PHRRDAYTCWQTKTGARDNNYGSRIDYILISGGLRGAVTDSDVWPGTQGSDHCPVHAEFDLSRLPDGGGGSSAAGRALEGAAVGPDAIHPPECSCFYPEYSGKQVKIRTFFARSGAAAANGGDGATTGASAGAAASVEKSCSDGGGTSAEGSAGPRAAASKSTTASLFDAFASSVRMPAAGGGWGAKCGACKSGRKAAGKRAAMGKGGKPAPDKQMKLTAFMAAPGDGGGKAEGNYSKENLPVKAYAAEAEPRTEPSSSGAGASAGAALQASCQNAASESAGAASASEPAEAEAARARELTAAAAPATAGAAAAAPATAGAAAAAAAAAVRAAAAGTARGGSSGSNCALRGGSAPMDRLQSAPTAARGWQALMQPAATPLCDHREETVERVVKKAGPNQGRHFFVCKRSAGNWPQDRNARCDFFQWSTKGVQGFK